MNRTLSEFDYMLDSYQAYAESLEELRQEFTRRFSLDFIENQMQIDDYVEGKGNEDSFCYWLEHKLAKLGSIEGGYISKFGIYYSEELDKYVKTGEWDQGTLDEDFNNLKQALVELIKAGKKQDFDAIDNAPFEPELKAKILSVYYPDQYLNIFSKTQLSYLLFQFDGVVNHSSLSRYEMEQKLIELKQEDENTRNWDNIVFGNYLYYLFPEVAKLRFADKDNIDYSLFFKTRQPKEINAGDKENYRVVPILQSFMM